MITSLLAGNGDGGQSNGSHSLRKLSPHLACLSWLSFPGQAHKVHLLISNAIEAHTFAAIHRETERRFLEDAYRSFHRE